MPGRSCRTFRRGVSRADVVALILSAVALAAVGTLILFRLSPHSAITVSMRDGTNLRQVHQGMVLFGGESGGLYPRPGLMKRKPVQVGGEALIVPGRGEENMHYNTTDRLYSSLIMQHYTSPALVVSPGEINPNVREMRNFDYDAFSPAQNVYWDERFQADLEHGSHTSYAHLLLYGGRTIALWHEQAPSHVPLLGTRGPRDGRCHPESLTCDRHGRWTGMVVRNDNTTMRHETMTPPNLEIGSGEDRQPDNLFAMEEGTDGEDVILTYTLAIDETGPTIQHD